MPESVETPAPVSAARRCPARTSTTSASEPAVIGRASIGPPYDGRATDSWDRLPTRYPSRRGSVSERPKEHASKACVGESPPWVQIPPLPPVEGPHPQHAANVGPFVVPLLIVLPEAGAEYVARMADLVIKALTEETFEDFAALNERNGGMFAGCWCTKFHPDCAEKDQSAAGNREFKRRLVVEGLAHAALVYEGDR